MNFFADNTDLPFIVSLVRIGVNELQKLQYLPRASEPREILAEDRTRCHADHVGHGFDRQTTAAVGLLKAVHTGERYMYMRLRGRQQ